MQRFQCSAILISALVVLALVALAPASIASARVRAAPPSPSAPPATLDEVLQAGLERGLPGVALRVERGDEVVFDGAAGLASLEEETPVAPTDRFGVGSITKTFTAALVLQLVDEQILTLDDTVTQWLDDPVVGRIPYVDRITLRQLLTHTSGVYDYVDDSQFSQDAYLGEGADWARVWTPQEVLAYAVGAERTPYFAPGAGVHYSNTGYVLLGLIIEQATGQSYAERLHAQILDPLGLTDTFYAATEPVPGGKVDAYQLIDGELLNVSAIDLSSPGAAGGMVSTTRDLARFAEALFGGELLRPATLEEMVTFTPSGRPNLEVGMGVFRWQTPSGALVGNSGDGIGSAARMYQPAGTDLTVVLLSNTSDAESVDAVFAEVVRVVLSPDASKE